MKWVDGSPVSAQELRCLYACFPSGVAALCAVIDNAPVGLAVSSYTSVSLDPPLVSVCIQNSSATWAKLQRVDQLGLSVLSEAQDVVCKQLSLKNGNRFAGVNWRSSPAGAVFIEGAVASLECVVYDKVIAGDHLIVVLRVVAAEALHERQPLVFHGSRFRKLFPEAAVA